MAEPDFAALKDDIAAHGLREPIWVWQGKILDGRNRHRACLELGVACPTREYQGQDPLGFILSMNLHRRHLNESQRAMVAAKMARLPQGMRADRAANLPVVITQAEAAAHLHVSERSVRDAHKVRTEAQPEVVQAVEAGTMAVSAATKLADKPVDVQRTVVKELESGTAKSVGAALKQTSAAPLSITRSKGASAPPTGAEGRWLDPLGSVQAALDIALNGFDSFGGVAAVISHWPPEQRHAFGERVAFLDTLWQRFLREYRALDEMSTRGKPNTATR
jgi:hypothetical protein